ncbi:unnamed protein product [Closterium sp. NIES-54]
MEEREESCYSNVTHQHENALVDGAEAAFPQLGAPVTRHPPQLVLRVPWKRAVRPHWAHRHGLMVFWEGGEKRGVGRGGEWSCREEC